MLKRLMLLALVMALLLPSLAMAEEAATNDPQATQAPSLTQGGGRRWRQQPAQPDNQEAKSRYVDENQDGICDNCGQQPGSNTKAPGFVDADGDGLCDHLSEAGQRKGNMMPGQGRRGQGRGKMQGQGRHQRQGRPHQGMPMGPGGRDR